MRWIFLVSSIVVFASVAMQVVAEEKATEGPDTMEGRWVVKSTSVNGKEDTGNLYYAKGTLWKLHNDGTGDLGGWQAKWKYDKTKRNFHLEQKGLFGFSTVLDDVDVTKHGENVIITFLENFGTHKVEVELMPEAKSK